MRSAQKDREAPSNPQKTALEAKRVNRLRGHESAAKSKTKLKDAFTAFKKRKKSKRNNGLPNTRPIFGPESGLPKLDALANPFRV